MGHAYIILLKILWASFSVISFCLTSTPNICLTCFFSFSEVLPACIDAKLMCSLSTKAFGSTLPLPSISQSGSFSQSGSVLEEKLGARSVYSLFSCQEFLLLPFLCLPMCSRGILIFCFLQHSQDCLYFLLTCCSVSAGQLTLIP